MRQVAIIGNGNSDFDAPWKDPSWEKWGLPWHPLAWHYDRLFEIHPMDLVTDERAGRGGRKYWQRLQELDEYHIPIYSQEKHDELEHGKRYPLKNVIESVGDYFGSSPAYMIALAIHEAVDKIGIWGVDLKEDIYDHQRPNIEYLLGFAHGRGIKVYNHPDSKVLSLRKQDHIGGLQVYYPQRYGFV